MNYPKIVVIFNAPPRCGKDTLAKLLPEYLSGPVRHDCFKRTLFEATEKEILPEFLELLEPGFWDSEAYNELKDDQDFQLVLRDGFQGTIRECLIHVSEDIYKPTYGNDYFGCMVSDSLEPGYNIFTDGGFSEELEPLETVSTYTIVIRLARDGYVFGSDSRGYLNPERHPQAHFIDFAIKEGETPKQSVTRLGIELIKWELKFARDMHFNVPAPYRYTYNG